MITLTSRAAERLKQIFAHTGNEFLRVAAQGGGCSGLQYSLLLGKENDKDVGVSEQDRVFESGGVKIVVDPISLRYLSGAEIDFDGNDVSGSGFKFKNPNAVSTCGCGQSFQPKE